MFNPDIMRLMQMVNIWAGIKTLMANIASSAIGAEAIFRCVQDNVDLLSSVRSDGLVMEVGIASTSGRRSVDFADWKPELPHSVRLFVIEKFGLIKPADLGLKISSKSVMN